MGKHRTRLKILASILSVVSENTSVKKTQIMYQAYLSYKLLVQYLNDIIEAGLVQCGNENCYVLTQKGKKFLAKFCEYDQSCKSVERELDYIEDQKITLDEMCPSTESVNVASSTLEQSLESNVQE
jgi:predicted transcriptional regulator